MPGRPASAKALRQEYAGSGEYCGTLSQIGDGNGGQLTRAFYSAWYEKPLEGFGQRSDFI